MLTQSQYESIVQLLWSPDKEVRELGISMLEVDDRFYHLYLQSYKIIFTGSNNDVYPWLENHSGGIYYFPSFYQYMKGIC